MPASPVGPEAAHPIAAESQSDWTLLVCHVYMKPSALVALRLSVICSPWCVMMWLIVLALE